MSIHMFNSDLHFGATAQRGPTFYPPIHTEYCAPLDILSTKSPFPQHDGTWAEKRVVRPLTSADGPGTQRASSTWAARMMTAVTAERSTG